jgi:hypothetical protein
MRRSLKELVIRVAPVTVLAGFALAGSGCSSEQPTPAPGGRSTPASASASSTSKSGATSTVARSVFTVGPNVRDPFYPRRKSAAVETGATAAPVDVEAQLRAGFQGVLGAGTDRIALINNVQLTVGRQSVIPLRVGNQERRVTVRCREILRNGVVLDVPGYPQPLTIVAGQRPRGL